ncbi:MAG: DNA-directed RNA polymerase subunit alpha [Parcubacteria group bacterium GW2011_GWA2_47_12]|nr:MAG: DNA-directed RNA polymerase subunit alpha [Parcubacteria group bacterium GW2011_GWA2_47_12]
MLTIVLPSQPRVIKEEGASGSYEIDGLYPGYGHTLGNSLRRIILSSLPGAAITSVKIVGASHEFTTLEGVKEDVISVILNLKRVRFNLSTDEPQTISLKVKGPKEVTAESFECPGQVSVLNPEQPIASISGKNTVLDIEARVEKGLGYVPKETIQKERVDIGAIALDAIFTPVRRVSYEVENMRVGDRTDFNRLRFSIETDGTIAPREALEKSIQIMLEQLRAIVGFRVEEVPVEHETAKAQKEPRREIDPEVLKTRVDTLDLSARAKAALSNSGIRTVGGLVRKKEEDILDIDGLGSKGVQEVKRMLSNFGITLK